MNITKPHILTKILALSIMSTMCVSVFSDANTDRWKLDTGIAIYGESYDAYNETLSVSGSYYFNPSTYSFGPMHERDYLNPSDSASFKMFTQRSYNGFDKAEGIHADSRFQFVRNNNIFSPRLIYSDFEGLETYGLGIDYARILDSSSQLSLEIMLNQEELATGNVLIPILGAGYRKLFSVFGNDTFGVGFDFSHTEAENESREYYISEMDMSLDYYFNRRWGVGLEISESISDISRHSATEINILSNFYFSPSFGMELRAGILDRDENAFDLNLALSSKVYF